MTLPPAAARTWHTLTTPTALLVGALVVAALFLFVNLGGLSLRNWDEGIHAEVSREIVTSHNWLDMHFMEGTYWRKPPLKFWLSAAIMEGTGPTEWAARAPNAAAGVLVVGLLCLWVFQVTRQRWTVPFLTATFFATTLFFSHTFRSGETDGVLTLFTLSALYAYWRAKRNPRWILWSALAIGLAIMTKSAAGVVPLIVMAIDATITRSWHLFGWRRLLWCLGIGSLVVLPWHIVELVRFGHPFWQEYFFVHVVDRGAEAIVNPTAGPFWYFKIVWIRFFPTLLITLPALVVVLRSLLRDRARDERLLWVIWFVIGFIVATTAKSKLDWYILPYYFPLLMLTAQVTITWLTSVARDWTRSFALLAMSVSAFTVLPDKIPAESNVQFVLPQFYLKLVGIHDVNPLTVAIATTIAGAALLWLLRRVWPFLRANERSERLALGALIVYLLVGGLWVNVVRIVKEQSLTGYKEAMAYVESQPDVPRTLLLFETTVWGNPAGYFYWNRHDATVIHDAGKDPANLDRLSRLQGNTYILTTTKATIPQFEDRPLRVINTWNEIVLLDRP